MGSIFVDRSSTDSQPNSIPEVYRDIEQLLASSHSFIGMPPRASWAVHDLKSWLVTHACSADVMLATNQWLVRLMRSSEWCGGVILKVVGDLPQGAVILRDALPYLRRGDVIWCTCTADQQICDLFLERPTGEPTVTVLPYGFDREVFFPVGANERKLLRTAWGFTPDDFVLLYVGRITIGKNIHSLLTVLTVLTELQHSGLNPTLLVVGRFEDRPVRHFGLYPQNFENQVRQRVEELDLSSRVRFIPWTDRRQLNSMYNLADVFVNLSLLTDENFGLPVVEAMSAGTPVVVTAWGGMKDTVRDGITGFSADTWVTDYGVRFDLPKVIGALELLCTDPDLRGQMSSNCVRHVAEHFAWSQYHARLLSLLQSVTSSDRRCETEAHLTAFGAAFHARFSTDSFLYEGRVTAAYPIYDSLHDEDYLRITEPYTSVGRWEAVTGDRAFIAITGTVEGRWFYSTHPLLPLRIPIDEVEGTALRMLGDVRTLQLADFNVPDETIKSLLRKGLIGFSSWHSQKLVVANNDPALTLNNQA